MLTPNELIKLLDYRGYDYYFHEHKALFTVEDSNKLSNNICSIWLEICNNKMYSDPKIIIGISIIDILISLFKSFWFSNYKD